MTTISMAPPNLAPTNLAPPNLVSLALVNQTASQRGVIVTYAAEQDGPHHMPTWTVKCLSRYNNVY